MNKIDDVQNFINHHGLINTERIKITENPYWLLKEQKIN